MSAGTLDGYARRLARAIVAGRAGRRDARRRPWSAALLGELDEAPTGREALLWALGGLRVAWLEGSGERPAAWRVPASRRRPALLAALSGLGATVTAVVLLPAPGRALAGSLVPERWGATRGDLLVFAGLTLLLLVAAVAASAAVVAIVSGRPRLASRLLVVAIVSGLLPAPLVGLLAAAARGRLRAAARRGPGDTDGPDGASGTGRSLTAG